MCLYSPSEWDHVDTDEIDIILLDDIFGKHQLDSSSLDSWMPVLKNMEVRFNTGLWQAVLLFIMQKRYLIYHIRYLI